MGKKVFLGLGSLIIILSLICIVTPISAVQHCNLNIFIRDQNSDPLNASIYVDNNYLGQYNHLLHQVTAWDNHIVEATKAGYESDSKTVSCSCSQTREVYLTLTQIRQYGNLSVKVTDCSTSQPISGAEVSITGVENKSDYTGFSGYVYFNHIEIGDYQITVSKSGYYSESDTKTVRCSQTTLSEICLTKIQVCTPGEIRNRECACQTQVRYEKCNEDGTGWEIILENCPSGQICEEGYCVQRCDDGYLNNYRCSGDWRQREYQYSDCSTDWKNYEYCEYGCNNGQCLVCTPNWQCGSWSNCINGEQTRQCSDGCGNTRTETQSCQSVCSIEVHVHNLEDEPIEGALVEIDSEKKITQTSGVVVFEDLYPKTYYVTAKKSGYKKDSGRVECECGEVKEVYLYLKYTTGNLKVHVSDCSTGEPITGADVNVINGIEKNGETNEYGYAYFEDLPARKYEASAIAAGYISNYKDAYVYEDEMTVIEICLNKGDGDNNNGEPDEVDAEIGDLNIYPSTICMDEDEDIEISLEIELEEGDDVDFKVKFYIRENSGWDYIGKDRETLYEDDEEEFNVEYEYIANSLEEGTYKIKAEIEYNDEEETEYAYLRVKDCIGEREDFEIGVIKLDPTYPKIGEMIIGNVPIKLVEDYRKDVIVEAWIDGRREKSENVGFSYKGQSKLFEFAFDTSNYGIGYHKIKIIIKTDGKTQEIEKEFYISKERYDSGMEEYQKEHCLRINEIKELNSPLKSGEKAEINVEIENCGDYMERNINLKLEDSDVIQKPSFSLREGEEKEFIFEFNVSETENLTINVWNGYNSISEKYNLIVYSGDLSIHIKPEYIVYANEDNKIEFSVKNLGKVRDEFELQVSENVVGWITELPEKIELEQGESKNIEIIVNPNVISGDYEFGITTKTIGSETTINSKFRVKEKWKFPTGDIIFTTGILPWVLLTILIIPILLLFYLVIIYLHRADSFTKEELPTRTYLKEEKPSGRTNKRAFWWDDC